MNCPKCGKEVNEGSIYCPYCNYRLQNYKLYNIAALISLPISMIGGIFAIISLYSINSSTVPINDSGLIGLWHIWGNHENEIRKRNERLGEKATLSSG